MASSFGAAGPFVVLMVWLYYSAQIFLLGAEFTVAYTQRTQPREGERSKRVSSRDRPAGLAGSVPLASEKKRAGSSRGNV